jgi:predicted DNA-binding mobile mystery protein A
MKNRKLIIEQLDKKIITFYKLSNVVLPPSGWIYSIRQGINMSLRQLGQRLSITPQSVKEIEEREKNGTISIKVLKQVAFALNMRFVYGFIPKEKTLEKMIESRAGV